MPAVYNICMKKRVLAIIVVSAVAIAVIYCSGIVTGRTYTAEHFGIETVLSGNDFNSNGTDDSTDILLGARQDAENMPSYDSAYYDTGYPPENIGVCTDLVWRAFRNAGYSLRDMVDSDIAAHPDHYPNITVSDSNIDFRRVINLHHFFASYAIQLTTDINDIEAWQPGDIVIFGNDSHIGIVSDRRDRQGVPYLIHNDGGVKREADYLLHRTPTAHYRFDGSLLPDSIIAAWH